MMQQVYNIKKFVFTKNNDAVGLQIEPTLIFAAINIINSVLTGGMCSATLWCMRWHVIENTKKQTKKDFIPCYQKCLHK